MFPFSSLLTQVPLIILAAAYMLYFGAYAVGKSKEIITEDQPESKEQSVIINQVSKADTFYFGTTSESTQYASEPAKRAVTFFRPDITYHYFDPDRDICSCFTSYSLFSRPPPIAG
ncbi:MAG: hypothetical protein IPH69_16215 [Bacteroidales bacterium]|nr:hypothetical protein [Bacteroidales bacterium]MBK7628026.1 hypothetical protein [Bacteroidales bacterium]